MQSLTTSRFAGCHVLGEFTGVDPALADNLEALREILSQALLGAGATICDMVEKKFEPQGVTLLALLAESHASIHTYPEHGALFVDVFTCADSASAEEAVRLLHAGLGDCTANVRVIGRGEDAEKTAEVVEPVGPGLTRHWELTETICEVDTEYQHMVIGRTAQGVSLFSDGDRQSTEASQLVYHEALMVPALLLAPKVERVLIIGSGEGVASQMAVAAGATRVDHVDIDAEEVRLCAEHLPYGYTPAELAAAERGEGPVHVHYRDGWTFVEQVTEPYDVVVIDLPDERPEEAQHNRLYGSDFLERCRAAGTVVVGQAGCPTLWRNETLLRSWARFNDNFETVVYFGSDEHEWAFVSGATGLTGDPVAAMTERLATLPYRPQTIDAQTLIGSTIPPISLRA